MKRIAVVITVLVFLLTACSIGSAPESEVKEPTLVPTDTPAWTSTSTPEITITPTTTLTQTLTNTTTPTWTSTASPTPTYSRTPTKTNTSTATPLTITNGDCIPSGTKQEIGVVTSVTDGDTILVEINGVEYRVRYIGIDAPESSDGELGISAANANTDLVLGKEVTLISDVSDDDSFSRLLRYVVVENIFVNDYLVRMGMASALSYPPDTSCDNTLQEAQAEALNTQAGMWSPAYYDPESRGVTPTSESLCNCYVDYDCGDFSSHSEAQACFESCGGSSSYDWSALDRDNDGIACESLP